MKTALLVIDVQESFRQRPYYRADPAMSFLARINALINACASRGVPIVRVLHVDPPATTDNPFSLESGHVRPMEGLADFTPAAEFIKGRHSALVGTGLSVWLREQGIGRLIISGARTEQCCETTARHASDEGFIVDYVPEATLTFDMQTVDGKPLPAAAIVERTCAVLHGRFATVCSIEEAVRRAA